MNTKYTKPLLQNLNSKNNSDSNDDEEEEQQLIHAPIIIIMSESSEATSRALTMEELTSLRCKAKELLDGLTPPAISNNTHSHESWLRGTVSIRCDDFHVSETCRFFDYYGFTLLPGFANPSTVVQQLKQQMADLTEAWDPEQNTMSFATDAKANESQGSDDYFLESASRVHFFAESHALDDKTNKLKPYYADNKLAALCKAGHGLHMIPGPFHTYTTSNQVKQLVAELGWKDPVVPQSMYICKNPKIGTTCHSHQDSTFLFTEPKQSCLGLWLALDDATLENGCLWVRPKSHWESVRRQFKRNVHHFGQEAIQNVSNVGRGNLEAPKMVFETLQPESTIPWEGTLPDGSEPPCQGLLKAGFIPIECKAGDLLAFCGELDHLSLPNYSDSQRHTFQLHLVEGSGQGIMWSKSNWLQYPKGVDFLSIKI